MHRIRHGCVIVGLLLWVVAHPRSSQAQYVADFQTNTISGVTSNWNGQYLVGNNNIADALFVRAGGQLLCSGDGYLGFAARSTNNSVLVADPGSIWSNSQMFVGEVGAHNSLVISNGGQILVAGAATIGDTSSNNSVLVTGSGSVWYTDGQLNVGNNGSSNRLVVSGGGQVINPTGAIIGFNSPSNSVIVTDPGSIWTNSFLIVGTGGNSLVISNGGKVVGENSAAIAEFGFGSNNVVVVTGSGSVWNLRELLLGAFGGKNSLIIGSGGQVIDQFGLVGEMASSRRNSVRVVDGGVWQNTLLTIGSQGLSNSLVVAGGSVFATNLIIGAASANCDNLVELDSGSLIVTNATGTGVLEVRHGGLILNGGVLQADTLVMTNPCTSLIHTGGTLIVGSVILDPNTFRIVSVARQGNDMLVTWMMAPGASNTLQATAGGPGGSYNTNSFADIFLVTNNTAIGTLTNYLDVGAATNFPARYYRARLVP